MTLILRVTGSSEAGGTTDTRTLTGGALVLGRAADCDIVLVDPERTLSNRHCRIERTPAGWVLTDTSTNGVFLDQQAEPLGRGNSAPLATGDVVHVGHYRLDVTIAPAAAAAVPQPPPVLAPDLEFVSPFQATREVPALTPAETPFGHRAGPIATPPEEPWLEALDTGHYGPGMLPARQGWDKPLDPGSFAGIGAIPGLVVDPLAASADTAFSMQAEHVPATSTMMPMPKAASLLPLDWDQPDAEARPPARPVSDEAGSGGLVPDIDFSFAPEAGISEPAAASPIGRPEDRAPNAIDGILSAIAPMPVPEALIAPQVLVEATYEAPAPIADVMPARSEPPSRPAAPLAGYVSPRARAEEAERAAAAAPVPVAAAAPSAAAGSPEALLDAFLEGAGISRSALGRNDPETVMRNAGAMMRIAVDGLREIMTTRAMMKAELRVEHTILRPGDNNTLKFVPDLQSCLMALLGDPPPGFMAGPACVQQSLDDVKRHEIAMVAALSGAFGDMLGQLDPERIRAEGDEDAGLGTMFPTAKKARYWQIFERIYRELKDRQGDGQGASLIGPMGSAYARQLSRVS